MKVFHKTSAILILLLMGCWAEEVPTNPVVQCRTGKVKGIALKSEGGKDYHAFFSIPYGKSTSGLLRFKPPKRVDAWDGIFDATKTDPIACSQFDSFTSTIMGTEDCLVINVYVPQHKTQTALPVLVFIHGGGFSFGSSSSHFYGPEKFMDHGVILVTFNYRLGIFGFFNTQDSVSPGNYGMLDQVLALRWVNENIASFGGDPEYVTIFGESAGGASVVYHMISPLSQGLFSNAIAQSGSALNPWALQRKPLEWAQRLADTVHCPTTYTAGMLDCFLRTSSRDLIEGGLQLSEVSGFPIYAGPSVEGPGGEGFLTEDPAALIKSRKVNKVPFFAGIMKDEGYIFYQRFQSRFKNEGQKFLDEDFTDYLSAILKVEPEMKNVTSAIMNEYFADKNINNTKVFKNQLRKMLSESLFGAGVSRTLDMFAEADVPTLGYLYTYQSERSLLLPDKKPEYVTHADELPIQFHMLFPQLSQPSVNDTKFSAILNSLWANIAAGAAPMIKNGDKEVYWDLYDTKDRIYLNLNLDDPRLEKGKLCVKEDFWMDTIPKLMSQYAVKVE